MKKQFACLLVVVALSATTFAQEKGTLTTWEGTLDVGAAKLRLEIDVTDTGGKLTGLMRSLDQGNVEVKMSDVKLNDKEFSFKIPQVAASFNGTLSDDKTVAEGTFTQGADFPFKLTKGKSKEVEVEPEMAETLKEAWIGELDMGVIKPKMQFRIVTREDGQEAAYFDSLTEGLTDFEAEHSIKDNTLVFKVPKIALKYTGELNETKTKAEGKWTQGARTFDLVLEKKSTEYENKNKWENRPQKPKGPFPYIAEEVKFENKIDDLTLAGTLTIPKKPGKHPAVVLISGSGAQDRDESLMEHKPFLVLADYLSRRGIAVLRFDDRGTAESTGTFKGATTADFAKDASAAVEFLKTHKSINPKEIGLAGHSEGGLIAPLTVGLRDDVAFVVLMAATGVDGAEILSSQTAAMLRASGVEQSEVDLAVKVNKAAVSVIKNAGKDNEDDLGDELEAAVRQVVADMPEEKKAEREQIVASFKAQAGTLQTKWMRFFVSHDPRPALKKIDCPVLAIIGSKDTQVVPSINHPEIEKALKAGGNKDYELVEIDSLNHLFQKCETGALSEYASIQETFNPEALKAIGDWISKRTTIVD